MGFWKKVVRHPEITRGAAHIAMGTIVAVIATAVAERSEKKALKAYGDAEKR